MSRLDDMEHEGRRRLAAIRQAMGEHGHDLLVIYGTTGVGTPMNGKSRL